MKLPEIEILIKYNGAKRSELRRIESSRDIYTVLGEMYNKNTVHWCEEMILICLNNNNKVLGYYKISAGGTTGTVCDPKVVFTIALNCVGTTAIILSHNHPSGRLEPSIADRHITAKIKAGGLLLDINLLDHIIYTDEGFYSFADEGLL